MAQVAGVSQATVSRVLQGSARVQPETRRRVLAAMAETDYRPHAAARAMRTRRVGTVGVVVADIINPFYPQLLEALGRELESAGQRMILWNDTAPGERSAVEAIRERSVDGLLFTTVVPGSRPLLEALRLQAPIVLLNRVLEQAACDQVTSDNEAGGRLVADYLHRAGHRRIAYLAGPPLASTSVERERGVVGRLAELGRPLPEELRYRVDFDHDAGRAAMHQLLRLPDPPTAVACANDLVAFGALDAARSLARRVPDDVWVVGFDDIGMASWDVFDLTTVRQPIAEMAAVAVDLLLERIADPGLPVRRRVFSSELVVRGTTARSALPRDLGGTSSR